MPRRIDIPAIRNDATSAVASIVAQIGRFEDKELLLDDLRWSYCMALVDLHAIWERFAERRLIAALNQHPAYFLAENSVNGISRIPAGLSKVLVRGGKFFDFRSFDELSKRSRQLVDTSNPFAQVQRVDRDHLDAMSALRNQIVHRSDASWLSYKRCLRTHFNIRSAPTPGEFLASVDRRAGSPQRGSVRFRVFAHVVSRVCSVV